MTHLVKMKATKAFTYANRQLSVDEEFNAHRKDVRVLDAIGKAKVAAADEEAGMQPEKPNAAPAPSGKTTSGGKKPTKAYKRRDIKPSETK